MITVRFSCLLLRPVPGATDSIVQYVEVQLPGDMLEWQRLADADGTYAPSYIARAARALNQLPEPRYMLEGVWEPSPERTAPVAPAVEYTWQDDDDDLDHWESLQIADDREWEEG
jgi:hypothetical protein